MIDIVREQSNDEEIWIYLPEVFTAYVEDAIESSVEDNYDITAQEILDSYNEDYGEDFFESEDELEDEEESYDYLGYIESRLEKFRRK